MRIFQHVIRWAAFVGTIVVLTAAFPASAAPEGLPAILGSAVAAQEEEPQEFAAAIYTGDCNDPDVSSKRAFSDVAVNQESSSDQRAYSFVARLDTPVKAFLAESHALMIDTGSGDVATPFGCATVSGAEPSERVVAGITAVDTGQLVGVAVISEADQGGTSVVIFLLVSADGQPLGQPEVAAEDEPSLDAEVLDDADAGDDATDESDSPEGGV